MDNNSIRKLISNLDVSNDKSGNTLVKFTINHSDGKVQKEIKEVIEWRENEVCPTRL